MVSRGSSLCSGAITIYVAPNKVSALVVYTVNTSFESDLAIGKFTSAPVLFPIQFFCISLIDSLQSRPSKSSNKRSAYAVIFNIHWRIVFLVTAVPQRSHLPSFTSSLARPVKQLGHQLIGASASYAKPFLKSCKKIHCVHL